MPLRLLPSTEVLVVAYLKSVSEVTALATGGIATELYAGTNPGVWLSLVTGGESVRNHLISPVIDVRSYGGTKGQADVLARTVHAALLDAPGTHAAGVVTDVETLTLPAWSPDDGFEPPRPRYLASYRFTIHPSPS